jgi:hypothetical protein
VGGNFSFSNHSPLTAFSSFVIPSEADLSVLTKLQAAEKLAFLKGTAFRPYITALQGIRL